MTIELDGFLTKNNTSILNYRQLRPILCLGHHLGCLQVLAHHFGTNTQHSNAICV